MPQTHSSTSSRSCDYEKALKTVDGTLQDKRHAGESAQRLFKDDYDDGKWWKSLCATLESLKAAAKSGAVLEEVGTKVAKIAKEYA